jgi:aminoglycoside phosphotransferase (APT) family kinase protein
MRPHDIGVLCEAIVPGRGPIQISELSQGLVNRSLRVVREARAYALRLPIADGGAIALDRGWEARLLQIAADARLAPALRYSDAARGILLSDWVQGYSWEGTDICSSASTEKIAQLLRRVHALTIALPAHQMSPTAWVRHYESAGESAALKHGAAAADRLNEWAGLPAAPLVVCHGDLHVLNLVQSGDSLWLLDWEYAHVNEAFWDLAGWCANGDFDQGAKRRLLGCYLGSPPNAEQWRRLELLIWLYDYICLQWSGLYLSQGPTPAAPTPAPRIAARAALLDARLSLPAN